MSNRRDGLYMRAFVGLNGVKVNNPSSVFNHVNHMSPSSL